jgi:hypothetical protein
MWRRWLLLPVGDPPERQSVVEFSAGDKAEAARIALHANPLARIWAGAQARNG